MEYVKRQDRLIAVGYCFGFITKELRSHAEEKDDPGQSAQVPC
jgi:hypothetical protein